LGEKRVYSCLGFATVLRPIYRISQDRPTGGGHFRQKDGGQATPEADKLSGAGRLPPAHRGLCPGGSRKDGILLIVLSLPLTENPLQDIERTIHNKLVPILNCFLWFWNRNPTFSSLNTQNQYFLLRQFVLCNRASNQG